MFGSPAPGGFGSSPAPAAGGFGFGASPSPAPAAAAGGGLFGGAASSPAAGGGLFGGGKPGAAATPTFGAAAPATGGGGLFGAASSPAPAGGGLFGAASSPAPAGGGLFGAASSPAPAGGLFGAGASGAAALTSSAAPATGGTGLFGGTAGSGPAVSFGSPAPAGGGLFGASAPAAGGGLFGAASTPATGGSSLFGAAPASMPALGSGGLFGGQPTGQQVGPLATHQPQGTMLATVDGQPVKHFTQWGELAPHSQQQLQALEAKIVSAREDSKTLDGVSRLQGDAGRSGAGDGGAQRRELERSAKAASDALKLLETQLWSDNERLGGLREAVVATLRDAEHARARLTRVREAEDAEAAGISHARTHPGQPPPPEATPVYLPPPQRPSAFLKGAIDRLYAAAEGFERGTLEMERNLRATGRVHGHGGAGPGLEALTAALHGGAFPAIGNGDGGRETYGDGVNLGAPYGGVALDAARAGPAELRAAVEGAQRYFNKVGGDLARLHEKVRRAKAEHLAALRRRGEHRDPFVEAEAAEAEYARLSAMAERPGFASAPPAGLPGANAPAPAALPAPGVQTPGAVAQAPGATPGGFGFGGGIGAASPASTPALFGATASTGGGGLFGAASSPAPAGGGLFGAAASSPAPAGGGLFGGGGAAATPGTLGAPAPAGGGLFGGATASAPAFGSPAPTGGGLFGAPTTPGAFGAPATQQPRRARRR